MLSRRAARQREHRLTSSVDLPEARDWTAQSPGGQSTERALMQLRPATPADTPFLRQLHHRAYRDVVLRQFGAWDESAQDGWFEQGLDEAVFSVVELDGAPVAALALHELPDHIVLVELQVLPEHQSRGIGTQLLQALLDRARSERKPVSLRVLLQNRARELYGRHGFLVTGTTETHYLMEWRASD